MPLGRVTDHSDRGGAAKIYLRFAGYREALYVALPNLANTRILAVIFYSHPAIGAE